MTKALDRLTATILLDTLKARGVDVGSRGDRLVLTGPRPAYEELLTELVTSKVAILQVLRLRDPRPDLDGDSAFWDRLLTTAEDLDGDDPEGLCGALRGLRSLGAVLVESEKGWRLEASQDYWSDPVAWQADTGKWLLPHLPALRRLLAQLGGEATA